MQFPKISHEQVSGIKDRKSNIQQNGDINFIEVFQQYELCKRAQIEKHNLEFLLKNLPPNKQAKAVQQIQTISSIFTTTRNRLRMNLSISQTKLKQGQQDNQIANDLNEIKEFLKHGNQPEKQLKILIQSEPQRHDFFESPVPTIQAVQYKSPEVLNLAKKKIQSYHDKKIELFGSQLDNLFQKANNAIKMDDDQEELFYQNVAKQLEKANQKQTKIYANQFEDLQPSDDHLRGMDLASSHIRLDKMDNYDDYFRERAIKMRTSMKNACEQIFKKKFGNSLVKIKRQKQQNLQAYQLKLQIELKSQMSAKLEQMKNSNQVQQPNDNAFQTTDRGALSKSNICSLHYSMKDPQNQSLKMQSPRSFNTNIKIRQSNKYEDINDNAQALQSTVKVSKNISKNSCIKSDILISHLIPKLASTQSMRQFYQIESAPYKSPKKVPYMNEINYQRLSIKQQLKTDICLKKVNQQLIQEAVTQYKGFINQQDDLNMLIESYQCDVNHEIEREEFQNNKQRRGDF